MNLGINPQVLCDGRCAHCYTACGTGGCITCSSSQTFCTCGALVRCGCGLAFDHPAEKCSNIVMPRVITIHPSGWFPVDVTFHNPPIVVSTDFKFS